jgi:hypothetical protein
VILRAFLARRSVLIGLGTGLRIIGSRYSLDTRRLGEFAARNRLPHRWIDLEHDTEAEALLRQAGISPHETPVVILRDQRVMRNPTTTDLARALGLHDLGPTDGLWDVIVVVEGPAGLAAAVGVGNSDGQAALFLSKPGIACLPSHPPRRHRRGHVALSRRPDRANTVDRGTLHTEVRELRGVGELDAIVVADIHTANSASCRRRDRSCSSVRTLTPRGSSTSSRSTTTGSC